MWRRSTCTLPALLATPWRAGPGTFTRRPAGPRDVPHRSIVDERQEALLKAAEKRGKEQAEKEASGKTNALARDLEALKANLEKDRRSRNDTRPTSVDTDNGQTGRPGIEKRRTFRAQSGPTQFRKWLKIELKDVIPM